MSDKKLIAIIDRESAVESAKYFDHNGADGVGYYEEKVSIDQIKKIADEIDAPLYVGGGIHSLEDVKKALYAGAQKVVLGQTVLVDKDIVKKASDRFGKEQVIVSMDLDTIEDPISFAKEMKRLGAYGLLLLADYESDKNKEVICEIQDAVDLKIMVSITEYDQTDKTFEMTKADYVCVENPSKWDVMEVKHQCKSKGIDINTYESSMSFDEFKLNQDGMITVVTQDYKTNQVLMVAYMTKEAFEQTVKTGIMTYYSRSRDELWVKGETSGHYQYVKSLSIDCDKDTLLAKVEQIGAACHTGNYSCFYTDIVKKEFKDDNPMEVFQSVYDTIMDRKEHPKEGSYTNYLFHEGIDKILKKVGEEATEIVIAAKNPGKEEVKYEISDFLYHVMVLMAEKGLTWEEVTKELLERK